MGGMAAETNTMEILQLIDAQAKLEKSEVCSHECFRCCGAAFIVIPTNVMTFLVITPCSKEGYLALRIPLVPRPLPQSKVLLPKLEFDKRKLKFLRRSMLLSFD